MVIYIINNKLYIINTLINIKKNLKNLKNKKKKKKKKN